MEKNITPPTVCNLGSPYDFWGKKKLIKTAQLEQIQTYHVNMVGLLAKADANLVKLIQQSL